ncbi:Uncharacterized conserved protein YlxW, UPF0749 family [Natronincola peptidivorans]|uniref:Uncharacterized conserved protein YlxW, UPF0749 family n=1 Tax=Natronincola peptidivorans TaxID=426128 RepID=A0A1H9Y7E3_9FIRM|nr:DUF881 domain-containing protein [Natronincola peptidivorans]SES64735.1 Uncharacterized conserved protein YlxW, UPF0749 family [Natronincola peptidivorans]
MNLKGKVSIGLLCGILGLIIAMQFNTIRDATDGGFLSTQKAQQLAMDLRNLRTEKERLNEELTSLEIRLKNYEVSEADENLIIKNLRRDLEYYQLLAGYKEGEGPGVVVTIDDPPNDFFMGGEGSFIMYNYDVLLEVINQLNAAGAEAIAINDQRYISTTEIYYTSNSVLINNVPTRPPFNIKAIGNPETLEAALNIRYGIVWQMRQYHNLQVNVRKENAILMPRYNKIIQHEYAKPIEPIQ